MTYEELAPQIEAAMKAFEPAMEKMKPDFWGAAFLMYMTFGALIAFRFGLGFG